MSSLLCFSAHRYAGSLLPTVVNHSPIYDENPDLHYGLLGCVARRQLADAPFMVVTIVLQIPQATVNCGFSGPRLYASAVVELDHKLLIERVEWANQEIEETTH